jgi:polyribonucleotide nucleotidyltransferase
MRKKEFSLDIGGKTLRALFTDLADQAHGSVIVSYGETALLATAVISDKEREGDFFPLTVDFEERFYAGGTIGGSRFLRRESKPSDEAILSGRIVDRTIRPLFPYRMRNEVQVVITVLALGEGDPDSIATVAASLALGTSEIPWNGPVSSVKIARNKGGRGFLTNPSRKKEGDELYELDLTACGKDGLINMIEVGAYEIGEKDISLALKEASLAIEKIQRFQKDIIAEIGRAKRAIPLREPSQETLALFERDIAPKILSAAIGAEKIALRTLKSEWLGLVKENLPQEARFAESIFEERVSDILHDEALDSGKRADGRKFDEIRPISTQAGGVSTLLHGSGIFYRGGTHVLSVLTLGGPKDSLMIEGMEGEGSKRFMHQYNFPPFSTGETGRAGSTNRRMIGHGALAEKALIPVIPAHETFPYAIRIVSEALASNGSTSMASVCASSLALLDGGVPIQSPVAGIALGLMSRESKGLLGKKKYEYKVLTDIQGPEDHHGDMDLKVAGTRDGVTAIQMDVKVSGIPLSVLEEALEKGRIARLKILSAIESEIAAPRKSISSRAPEIAILAIEASQVGLIIGSGGKTINAIEKETGAKIDIGEGGMVSITGKNGSAKKAKEVIENILREYKSDTKRG